MTFARWLGVAVAGTMIGVIVPATPALAHGGGQSVTSNYRTRITQLTPHQPGLRASVTDIAGTIRLTWTGSGNVTVSGYENEPYLRITASGVERNTRSPATYLNQDRYATTPVPASADATATPEWQRVSSERSFTWHDHRTHWMDRVPPASVSANPQRITVIFDHWTIPILVDGQTGTIAGDLAWVPPPPVWPWLGLTAVLAVIIAIALFARSWRTSALVVAAVATVVFTLDSVAYFRASSAGWTTDLWVLGWPVLAIVSTVWIAMSSRDRSAQPTVAIAVTGIVLAIAGGWDRSDVFTSSQIFSAAPDWTARVAVAVCIAGGALLCARFLAYVVPLAIGRGPAAPTTDTTTIFE